MAAITTTQTIDDEGTTQVSEMTRRNKTKMAGKKKSNNSTAQNHNFGIAVANREKNDE
jgi:hypothetical protein